LLIQRLLKAKKKKTGGDSSSSVTAILQNNVSQNSQSMPTTEDYLPSTEEIEKFVSESVQKSTQDLLSIFDKYRRIQGKLLLQEISKRYGLKVEIRDDDL